MMHGRKIGTPEHYKGHTIQVTFYQPDFRVYVDGQQVGQSWLDVVAAHQAGARYVDETVKAAAEAAKEKSA